MRKAFELNHKRQFGFIAPDKAIIIETIGVTSYGGSEAPAEMISASKVKGEPIADAHKPMYSKGQWHSTPIYKIESLEYGHEITGPAIIIEPTGTIVIEANWQVEISQYHHIILTQNDKISKEKAITTTCDPVTLEIFNNLFMSIAEQMGIVLRNTSQSVNIKERLDFSCAVFDKHGNLVANAPHVPVHLGSMDSSVKVIINSGQQIKAGDVFVQNNPYNGGSHLPDITVITPVFNDEKTDVIFYVASRAHHEDIGGIAPGSMSPLATSILQEGVILDNVKLVSEGVFLTDKIHQVLSTGDYPARNIEQNIADLMAQIAANNTGVNELNKLVNESGLSTVHAYMEYIQDSAEEAVRNAITRLQDNEFSFQLDSGAEIHVSIKINHKDRSAIIDFTGTSKQLPTNFNAPKAITHAAVLYVFRCLVDDDIPLNAGCMKPLKIIVPQGSMLNPEYPAAVVAGNVETSQAVTNGLFAALGILGSSQGTMNNLTFGNEKYQYYETICSGSPAGEGFHGTAAVHTHMTNTRMTDPEIMEQRYPVLLQEFSIRRDSGGKGKWNAGDGIYRNIRFEEEMSCSILSEHRLIAPFGLHGGESGQVGRNWVERKDHSIEELGGCGHTDVYTGDCINIISPTGGGFCKR
jgi:5-oxoprolinase (ATP-hydrolysing)